MTRGLPELLRVGVHLQSFGGQYVQSLRLDQHRESPSEPLPTLHNLRFEITTKSFDACHSFSFYKREKALELSTGYILE